MSHELLPALRIPLSGIAALAQVKRPVVSMWRLRTKDSDLPFPPSIATESGQEFFDAVAVAHWLIETGRGNNPDAVADAAAHATPPAMQSGHAASFPALTALIALRASHGEPLGDLDAEALLDLAEATDTDDQCLAHEVEQLGAESEAFARFVDVLVDGAYSAAAAFESVMASRFRDGRRELVRATLSDAAINLVAGVSLALAATNPSSASTDSATIADPTGAASDLLTGIVATAGESVELNLVTADGEADAARLLRRRLMAHGVPSEQFAVHESGEFNVSGAVVHVAQYPSQAAPEQSPLEILNAIDSIVLQMDDAQRGVVIAPASVLCDGRLAPDAAEVRSALLRSGRVRGIVRLPAGLLTSSPRRVLALWVLGPAHETVALASRWTMVANLDAVALEPAAIADLVSDLTAAMGDGATVRAHAFRFARRVLTSALLARTGSLITGTSAVQHTAVTSGRASSAAVAVRVEDVLKQLGEPTSLAEFAIEPSAEVRALPPTSLGDLAAGGHLRYFAGTRIRDDDVAHDSGFAVVGVDELTRVAPHGSRTIDRLVFASRYPSARLTEPGDVVFCTGPATHAWVDREGSSVVAYPARILRISSDDSAGVLAELLAADIEHAPSGSRDWRRWIARRVQTEQRAPLVDALAAIGRERDAALARLAHLNELAALLSTSVAAGTLTLAEPVEARTPTTQNPKSKGPR